ncbi:RNA polymerase sigma factor [Colwelliaceae bacterium 6471]
MNQKGFGQAISLFDFVALKKGRHDGFNAAYHTYADHVYSLSLHIIGNEQAASDVLQTVFETLLVKSSSLNSAETLGGWLKQSTINACMGYFRRNKHEKIKFEENTDMLIEALTDNYEKLNEKDNMTISSLLETLPVLQRSIIYAYAVQDLRHKEVASTIGINEAYSRQVYKRAITQLRVLFEKVR